MCKQHKTHKKRNEVINMEKQTKTVPSLQLLLFCKEYRVVSKKLNGEQTFHLVSEVHQLTEQYDTLDEVFERIEELHLDAIVPKDLRSNYDTTYLYKNNLLTQDELRYIDIHDLHELIKGVSRFKEDFIDLMCLKTFYLCSETDDVVRVEIYDVDSVHYTIYSGMNEIKHDGVTNIPHLLWIVQNK